MTQGNPKAKKGRWSLCACPRCPSEHGKARHPPLAGRSPGEEEEDAEGSPSSLGITKAENYKTKYKGENSARECASEPSALQRQTLALPAPCRGVHFASSLPGARPPVGRPGGQLPPALGAPVLLHRRLAKAAPHTL